MTTRWQIKSPDVAQTTVTVAQIVADNIARARKLRGLTQEELAARLRELTGAQWPRTAVSMAEGAWLAAPWERVRKFDVNQLVALSLALDMPAAWFLLPPDHRPDGGEVADEDAWIRCGAKPDDDLPALSSRQLTEIAISVSATTDSPDGDPLHERVRKHAPDYVVLTAVEGAINTTR